MFFPPKLTKWSDQIDAKGFEYSREVDPLNFALDRDPRCACSVGRHVWIEELLNQNCIYVVNVNGSSGLIDHLYATH